MKNSIKKVSAQFEILEINSKKTFSITKDKEKITFYDERLIEEVINRKFNDKYKRLLYIIADINNSEDTTESDTELVRKQIDELKSKLINKYGKYINEKLLNKYLKMLLILESKIEVKEKRNRGR